jgi:hypothetical protein
MVSAMTNLVTGTIRFYGLRFSLCFEPLVLALREGPLGQREATKNKAMHTMYAAESDAAPYYAVVQSPWLADNGPA